MQINSSVNTGYYTSYRNNTSVKHGAGFTKTEKGGFILNETTDSKDKKMTTYYQGVPLEEWAVTDPKYTDPATGISWHIRDGKFPYMVGEDAERFEKLCKETGEFPVKKFAEMTGFIQQLDENTVAYIGQNGIAVEGKDGRELFVDTSHLSYDELMKLFDNLPETNNYFNSAYWSGKIRKA